MCQKEANPGRPDSRQPFMETRCTKSFHFSCRTRSVQLLKRPTAVGFSTGATRGPPDVALRLAAAEAANLENLSRSLGNCLAAVGKKTLATTSSLHGEASTKLQRNFKLQDLFLSKRLTEVHLVLS